MNINKKYLPSREFARRIAIVAIICAVGFGIYGLVKFIKARSKNPEQLALQVKEGVEKDSNANGIPDWEETLWGLDPQKSGPENKEFILAKRKTIATERPDLAASATGPKTENELLSQEFFAVIMSLQQSNNLDQNAINAVSGAIGKKIEATPIPDKYTRNMLIIKESNATTISDYYASYIQLLGAYDDKNIGDELTFINQGLVNHDQNALDATKSVSAAYKAFGKDFLKIPVPERLSSAHLDLANDYEKVGQSIDGLTNLLADPLGGMRSFINYKKYSDSLLFDIDRLTAE